MTRRDLEDRWEDSQRKAGRLMRVEREEGMFRFGERAARPWLLNRVTRALLDLIEMKRAPFLTRFDLEAPGSYGDGHPRAMSRNARHTCSLITLLYSRLRNVRKR